MTNRKLKEDVANTGSDFIAFKTSRVGQYLMATARKAEADALKKLAKADPTNEKEIRDCQFAAAIPAQAILWIEAAIRAGEDAKFELSQEDNGY